MANSSAPDPVGYTEDEDGYILIDNDFPNSCQLHDPDQADLSEDVEKSEMFASSYPGLGQKVGGPYPKKNSKSKSIRRLPIFTRSRKTSQAPSPCKTTNSGKQTSPSDKFSEEFATFVSAMMSLNSSVVLLYHSLSIQGSGMETEQVSRVLAMGSPLLQFTKLAVDADKCIRLAIDRIVSLKSASDETLSSFVKQLEEKDKKASKLTAKNQHLQQLLDKATARDQTLEKQIEQLKQMLVSRRDSSRINWQVERAEVEIASESLGTGAYTTVTAGVFRGSRVAVKCLHSIILSSHNRRMFEREMNIAARIRHPNLVQFMGAVVDEEPIILMELMPITLREVLPKKLNKLTQKQIPQICKDIARALTYLHAMKPEPIIHRDISSANVLLEPAADSMWKAKVSDYGSANFLSMINTKAPGNAVYTAPEAKFPQQQSPKMDVFSFGMLVMEIYLQEFPVANPNSRDQMVCQMELLYPDILPMVKNCLHYDPSDRPCMLKILQCLSH